MNIINKTTLLIFVGVGIIVGLLVGGLTKEKSTVTLGGVVAINNYDTTSAGFTVATSTVNTTSTQVFSSINRVAWIQNITAGTLWCSLDGVGTTAASSTLISGRGLLIAPTSTTLYGLFPSVVSFGECRGQYNCYPHKGAVNCLGSAASVVLTITQ